MADDQDLTAKIKEAETAIKDTIADPNCSSFEPELNDLSDALNRLKESERDRLRRERRNRILMSILLAGAAAAVIGISYFTAQSEIREEYLDNLTSSYNLCQSRKVNQQTILPLPVGQYTCQQVKKLYQKEHSQ